MSTASHSITSVSGNGTAREKVKRCTLHLPPHSDLFFQPPVRECVRDYSVQCPEGFIEDSTDCIAPSEYNGPCNKLQPELHLLSNTAKASWAWACKADYPCIPDTCPTGSDYSHPCPIGWYAGSSGECESDDAASKCSGKIFVGADYTAKAALEEACGVRWPCKRNACLKDYGANCPGGWSDLGSALCQAPGTYRGPCSQRIDMKEYEGRDDMKKAFESRCSVSWLCNSNAYQREREYSAPCPLGWAVLESGSCRAPAAYTPSHDCPRTVSFIGRSEADRQSYAALCDLDFPFRGELYVYRTTEQALFDVNTGRKRLLRA